MNKIYFIILLVTTLLLTQCYTQYEYLTKDYNFERGNQLIKIILSDSSVVKCTDTQYQYKVKSDSLLILYKYIVKNYGNYSRYYTVPDTLNLKDIHSVFISKFDIGLTVLTIIFGGVVILGLLMLISSGPYFDLSNGGSF